MVLKFAAALALTCGFWVNTARADDTSDDIKCLAVSLDLSGSQDPDDQSLGMLGTMYWLGRLDGRTPAQDLEKQMQAGAFDMRPVDEKAEAARCAQVMTTRGPVLTKLGAEKQQRNNSN
jgi:hypothetical protein